MIQSKLPYVQAGQNIHLMDEDASQWASTRHGANAGRGFHYQDAISSWYAAQLLVSDSHTRVVPESHREDASCEGQAGTEVQAKSRQERVGLFPAREVAEHIKTLHARKSRNAGSTIELVLERDIRECPLPHSCMRLGDLEADHPLAIACKRLFEDASWPNAGCSEIRIRILSFEDARRGTADIVQDTFNVEPAVAARIAADYLRLIADAADSNAERDYSHRAGLDRTTLERAAHQAIAEIDPGSLVASINSGAIEPLDLDTPDDNAVYFQGIDAQPGHIAAGLPAPRTEQVDAVLAALSETRAVLIAGPSGSGKSTVLWMTAFVERHVSWYRVNRLLSSDVEDIYRFAVGRRPTSAAPLGFLVDGIGIGDMEAWDQVLRRLSPLQNVYLLGTARIEDLFAATTADLATRVDIGLDEGVAARIFEYLKQGGLTQSVHWREAFNDADGLTLEFTYQLTQGERLPVVLGAQVDRMVREGASDELQLLALVSAAHTHGIALSVESAQQAAGLGDDAFRRAMRRLKDEHLVLEDFDSIRGLHLHRSRALVDSVHANPPPTLTTTVTRLMGVLPESDLVKLVVGVLRDNRALDGAIIKLAASRTTTGSPELLGALLHAFRALDFVRHAELCAGIVEQAAVPPAHWPLVVTSGLTGIEWPESLFDSSLNEAINALGENRVESTGLRDAFIDAVDRAQVVETVLSQRSASALASLLSACIGVSNTTVDDLVAADWDGTSAESVLTACTSEEFAGIGHTAGQLSIPLAEKLLEYAGGESQIIERLLESYPTVFAVGREQHDGVDVASAKVMFIHEDLTPDPNARAHDVAKVLIRSLPGCSSAAIETVRAGGKPFQIGDLTFGQSGLLGQYALTSTDVDWNRARTALVIHELGTMSKGNHASVAAGLLYRAYAYLTSLADHWVTRSLDPSNAYWKSSEKERSDLKTDADQLANPLDGLALFREIIPSTGARVTAQFAGFVDNEMVPSALGLDSAHTVLHHVTDVIPAKIRDGEYGSLAAVAADLVATLEEVRSAEHWALIGLSEPPTVLDDLKLLLIAIRDIALALQHDAITPADIRRERSGPKGQVLRRVANLANRKIEAASEDFIREFNADLRARGFNAKLVHKHAPVDQSYWPRIDVAVIVQCEDVAAWTNQVDAVIQAVLDIRDAHHLPPTLIFPEFEGRAEPSLGCEVIRRSFPSVAGYYRWYPEERPAQQTHTLQSDVSTAIDQLIRCSAIQELRSRRNLAPEYEDFYLGSVTQFAEAFERITEYGDDACLGQIAFELNRLAMGVDDEGKEDGKPGNFACQALDLLSAPSDPESLGEGVVIGLLTLAAVQWMHNSDKAIELFG
ncbi:MAG: hypothetical protein Q7L55_05070 [Actinomycetota bacterium]|nr:hypothetical protein [Actinomycetota bacterium]